MAFEGGSRAPLVVAGGLADVERLGVLPHAYHRTFLLLLLEELIKVRLFVQEQLAVASGAIFALLLPLKLTTERRLLELVLH